MAKKQSIFSTIPDAIKAAKSGRMMIIIDDPSRENQGDVFFPAQMATEENVNFLISKCRGLVCAPISFSFAQRLQLPLMIPQAKNSESTCVNFTVSVDAATTRDFGISAADRALTLQTLGRETAVASDLVRPGHIFPLIARSGGIRERQGHTEAAVELCELAGFSPSGVICEILDSDGQPSRLPSLKKFAARHNLPIVTIADLDAYQKKHAAKPGKFEAALEMTATASLPTEYGLFQISVYSSLLDSCEHILITCGDTSKGPVLTRVHSSCFTGDTLLSLRCDCHEQLDRSMRLIQEKGSGAIVYLDQEGRGIGLASKIQAYALQEQGLDTAQANEALGFEVDARSYEAAADILKQAGIEHIDLLTNNPKKTQQLASEGIRIRKTIPLEISPNTFNGGYLLIKKLKMGHSLTKV